MRSYNQVATCFCALTSAVGAVLVEVPAPANFLRRSMAKAAVLGNYLYIDGGLITQLEDGELRGRGQNQVNTTLSIDLSSSWSSKDVVIRSTPKTPAPIKANQILWSDSSYGNGAFYTFGGMSWLGYNMTDSEVWRFSADGKGGGSWSKVTPANPSVLSGIKQTEHAAVAFTEEAGYAFGGLATGWTEKNRQSTQPVPGIVSFNFRTSSFSNSTDSPFETLIGAQARHVPVFGPNGLILVLGGVSTSLEQHKSVAEGAAHDFIDLTFVDPVTKEVFKQKATGDIPPAPRVNFCNVGFRTPRGGYDIFIMGGSNERDKFNYEDAYVLSLPGFVWTKAADSPAGQRTQHACVAVGNRQVLVVGGTTGSGMKSPDPAPQGLHAFDMTTMTWKYGYDANDGPGYESAKAINDWYASGSLAKVKWTSARVEAIFMNSTASASSSPTTTSSGSKATDSAGGDDGSLGPIEGKTPVGAIVGGVLGGLALLLIIALVAFVLLRKQRREKNAAAAAELAGGEAASPSAYQNSSPPGGGAGYVAEAPGMAEHKLYRYAGGPDAASPQISEATGEEKYHRHEAEGGHGYVEMYAAGGKPQQSVSVGVEPVELDAGNFGAPKK